MAHTIATFGLSGVGKTCYLYAMAQVMKNSIRSGNSFSMEVRSLNTMQEVKLNNGYLEMVQGRWPQGTSGDKSTDYHFRVTAYADGEIFPIDNDLVLHDYPGGTWTKIAQDNKLKVELFQTFNTSGSLIFFIGADTLLQAMDEADIVPEHRHGRSIEDIIMARNEIMLMDTILCEYNATSPKRKPLILVCVTKSDMFKGNEITAAKEYLRDAWKSLFFRGSQVEAAITSVALGENLTADKGMLRGNLIINTSRGIHLPIVYSIAESLSTGYDHFDPEEKHMSDVVLPYLLDQIDGHIDMYRNGERMIRV